MKLCEWCGKNKVEDRYGSCDECVRLRTPQFYQKVADRPLKGSDRWYKERWFREDQKTWEADIKSRKTVEHGKDYTKVGRFNERGDRVG